MNYTSLNISEAAYCFMNAEKRIKETFSKYGSGSNELRELLVELVDSAEKRFDIVAR